METTPPVLAVEPYPISQWLDFVRGLIPAAESDPMRLHLATGCAPCSELANFSTSLNNVCKNLADISVPEGVVRRAKALFPIARPKPARASFLVAELVFETLATPAPGFRGSSHAGWQALYRSEEYSLDLRVDSDPAYARGVTLVGQVCSHASPQAAMKDLPVLVKCGKSVVAQTQSNQFGEFQLEYERQPRLVLYVYAEHNSKCFRISLKKPLSSAETKPSSGD